jgi:glucosamine--fructose-6-phosphate aminotransferase (isomerizing)
MATASFAHRWIEGEYFRDILDQPEALRRNMATPAPDGLAEFAASWRASEKPFVVLTGMGSSFHALHPIAIRLSESGVRAIMLETSELIYYWAGLLQPETILIVVSQSGRSAEIVRLLQLIRERSHLIAVTNDADSPLARAADTLCFIKAGRESTVSCKTYVSSLLALDRIANILCSGDWEGFSSSSAAIAGQVEAYLAHLRQHVDEAKDLLGDVRHMVLAGRGPSLASAGTGGLIIKEAARFPAEGMSAAAFRHGPLEMVSPHLFLLLFEGDSRCAEMHRRLAADVAGLGGKAQMVSEDQQSGLFCLARTSESLRPILEILPVQMITLALAAREGREAGAFVHASKITSID